MKSGRKSSSVDKAFELINAVSEAGPAGVSLGELAGQARIAVSTAHRYVTSLLELGVLDRDAAGSYHLGVTLITLAGQYLEEDGLRAAARPYLVELVELSGETVHLGVPVGDQIVYVDKVESAKSVRLVSRIGSTSPLHSTAMGKAVLSLDERRAEEILAGPLERRTPRTLTGDALLAELRVVRERGYAIDDEENEEGVRCVGLPLMNASGQPVGAFSVSAPANRFSLDDCHRLAPTALAMAADISRRIGYVIPRHTKADARTGTRTPNGRDSTLI
ncbi:IclR family transcriptional regulator [Planotetraspora phitsanulokensis]|uniref:IclR family transcriptional regulator n=1 Tax=Planotetraspora phitsanulokensis TaxID=575192 RepID=A0A8J3U065_9ACTN|nr:IclR family transcriptional regulator [Planotetraspora phitsanulokensis]GII35056.1 IclR family transcriptional regulator [Planotetraspora phitsanulokensis]